MLQGLQPDSIYEICEPLPGNFTQGAGNYRIIETEGDANEMKGYLKYTHYYFYYLILSSHLPAWIGSSVHDWANIDECGPTK